MSATTIWFLKTKQFYNISWVPAIIQCKNALPKGKVVFISNYTQLLWPRQRPNSFKRSRWRTYTQVLDTKNNLLRTSWPCCCTRLITEGRVEQSMRNSKKDRLLGSQSSRRSVAWGAVIFDAKFEVKVSKLFLVPSNAGQEQSTCIR